MENKEEIQKDITTFAEIEAISSTKGGKKIIVSLRKDVVNAIDILANSYKDKSHIELIALCADLKSKLDLYKVLVNAKGNKEELEKILTEE